jgi:uncharacterized membrane protein YozB (DUF420 family)
MVYDVLNAAILVLILVGVALHHRRLLHAQLMKLCFVLDMLLLLAVEFLRSKPSAVGTAVDALRSGNNTVLVIHIVFSVAVLALWIVQLVLGTKVLRGDRARLPAHAKMAKLFLLVRVGNVVTAFMV